MLNDRGITPLPDDNPARPSITWAAFEDAADGYAWNETGIYNVVNPYLRSDIREAYTYGGAVSFFYCKSRPSMLMGRPSWRYGTPESETEPRLGDALAFSDQDLGSGVSIGDMGRRLSSAEERVQGLTRQESVDSSAAAKPFGALADSLPPHAAGVVLPVFTDVRLIPAALSKANLSERDPTFHMFLLEYFGDPGYPNVPPDVRARYIYYIQAIEWFSDLDSGFRQAWLAYDEWRQIYMAGPDGIPNTSDDLRDPCLPPPDGGGGGGGGGSDGGLPIIH
jgi:hypothetical protein